MQLSRWQLDKDSLLVKYREYMAVGTQPQATHLQHNLYMESLGHGVKERVGRLTAVGGPEHLLQDSIFCR